MSSPVPSLRGSPAARFTGNVIVTFKPGTAPAKQPQARDGALRAAAADYPGAGQVIRVLATGDVLVSGGPKPQAYAQVLTQRPDVASAVAERLAG